MFEDHSTGISLCSLRYEELLREERTINQELQALERKFETWAQAANDPASLTHRSATTQRPLASARDITKDLPPEVAAFEVSSELQQQISHQKFKNPDLKTSSCQIFWILKATKKKQCEKKI